MKLIHKKEVSLEETPILLRLERRHTLAGGRDPDPERPLSRANSVGSFTGLMGTPEDAAPPIHKCRSEDKRSMLSRASTIVITENELASSLLYNSRKAKMQTEAANEAPTPVSSPQPNFNKREVPISPVSPRPMPSLEHSKIRIKKGRSICCSYVLITMFVCLVSVGILMAIGGILYMELSTANPVKGPGDTGLRAAEGRLLESLYQDEASQSETTSKEDKPDPNSGLEDEINLKEEIIYLEKLGEVLSDDKPSQSEASEEASKIDLSLNLRGLWNKAFSELPKELSKMLPTLPDSGQIEQIWGGNPVEVSQNLETQGPNEGITIKSGLDNGERSVTYVQEVANPANVDETSDKSSTDLSKTEKKEELEGGGNDKRIPVTDITQGSPVSYVVFNADTDHQELKPVEVQEVIVPFDHANDHSKESTIPPEELSSNFKKSTESFQNTITVEEPSINRDSENRSSVNNIDNSSSDFVPELPITEVKSEDESKALPLEFFRRLGFDRDAIKSNPMLTVDDMNVKFSINEALKVLRNLDSNLPSSREKSTSKVPKVRPPVHVPKKVHDVEKERREYLLKLRRNMLFNLNRF